MMSFDLPWYIDLIAFFLMAIPLFIIIGIVLFISKIKVTKGAKVTSKSEQRQKTLGNSFIFKLGILIFFLVLIILENFFFNYSYQYVNPIKNIVYILVVLFTFLLLLLQVVDYFQKRLKRL